MAIPPGNPCGLNPVLIRPLLPIEECRVGSSDGGFDLLNHQVNSVPGASSKHRFYFLSMISLVIAIGKSLTMCFLGLAKAGVSWSNTHTAAD